MAVTLESLDAKIDAIASDVQEMKGQLQLMNGRQRLDHDAVTALKGDQLAMRRELERSMNARTWIGMALSAIFSAVAGYLGIRQ